MNEESMETNLLSEENYFCDGNTFCRAVEAKISCVANIIKRRCMGLKISYVEFLDAKFCYMEAMGYFVRVNLNLIATEANYLAI